MQRKKKPYIPTKAWQFRAPACSTSGPDGLMKYPGHIISMCHWTEEDAGYLTGDYQVTRVRGPPYEHCATDITRYNIRILNQLETMAEGDNAI